MTGPGDGQGKQRRVCMLVRTSVLRNPRVIKQARTLVREGWQVVVVSMGDAGERKRLEYHPDGFVILRTPLSWRARYRARRTDSDGGGGGGEVYKPGRIRVALLLVSRVLILLRMLPLIHRARPQVVLAHNVNTLLTGWLGARLTGASLAYDAHEVNLDREGHYQQLRSVIRVIEGCVMPRSDLNMTTTNMRARHFRRVYRLEQTPRVFENRPPASSFGARIELRDRLGLDADAVVALYQGGLQEGRGLHNMVRAMARVPGLSLVFLGDGPQQGSLGELARELQVQDRVYFAGQIGLDELPGWTASADFGLQLLRNTSFNHYSTDSNKLFEYGMAGLPVIASDFPEIRKIVRSHCFGLLVDPHDVAAVSNAMQRLVDDAELRRALGEAARQAAPQLSWEAVEADYVAQLEEILKA